ncbi:MAG: MFS transporter [Candidatus Helarchaeota archaeon]
MAMRYKANIWKAYIFNFFTSLHFIAAVMVPFFREWGGLNFTQIMILQGWFMFWIFILEIPTGTIADYLGRKQSLMLGAGVNVLGATIYGSVPNFYVFMVGEFLWGMAIALYSGATEAFIYDSLKQIGESEIKKSKKIFGRLETANLLGIMVGSIFGGMIAAIFNLQATMLLITIPNGIAVAVGTTFNEPQPADKTEAKSYIKILKNGVKHLHENKILKILALDMIFVASIAYFMIWLYQPLLTEAHVDIFYFGFMAAILLIVQILIMNNFERFERLFGSKRRFLIFSTAITGATFIICGFTRYLPILLPAMICSAGFGLSRRPLFINYMNKYISSEERATVLSTISMFERLVLALVNPFIGLLIDWSINYTLIILGSAAIMFLFFTKVEESYLID